MMTLSRLRKLKRSLKSSRMMMNMSVSRIQGGMKISLSMMMGTATETTVVKYGKSMKRAMATKKAPKRKRRES